MECAVPVSCESAPVFEKAIGALILGCELAKKECAALKYRELAQSYNQFFGQERRTYE
jgi:hypothetical protein